MPHWRMQKKIRMIRFVKIIMGSSKFLQEAAPSPFQQSRSTHLAIPTRLWSKKRKDEIPFHLWLWFWILIITPLFTPLTNLYFIFNHNITHDISFLSFVFNLFKFISFTLSISLPWDNSPHHTIFTPFPILFHGISFNHICTKATDETSSSCSLFTRNSLHNSTTGTYLPISLSIMLR
jgi:hypothetical protein